MAGDCDRDLQLGRGTPSKPDDAIGIAQEADVGSSGAGGGGGEVWGHLF